MNILQFAQVGGTEPVLLRALTFSPQITDRLCSIAVVWNNRLTSSAGRASPQTWELELNPRLKVLGLPEEPNATFLHEVAHFMAYLRHGKMDHSAFWWESMFQLGQWPRRTHSFGKAMKPEVLTLADLGL